MKRCHELSAYFEHTYIPSRRRPGRSEHYSSDIFPEERENHFETVSEGIATTTKLVKGWHYQTLPNTCTFSSLSRNIMDFHERT